MYQPPPLGLCLMRSRATNQSLSDVSREAAMIGTMPRKPKQLSEQSRRFIEFAKEVGADASEEEFKRKFCKAVPPKQGGAKAAGTPKRTKPGR